MVGHKGQSVVFPQGAHFCSHLPSSGDHSLRGLEASITAQRVDPINLGKFISGTHCEFSKGYTCLSVLIRKIVCISKFLKPLFLLIFLCKNCR